MCFFQPNLNYETFLAPIAMAINFKHIPNFFEKKKKKKEEEDGYESGLMTNRLPVRLVSEVVCLGLKIKIRKASNYFY